MQISDFVMQCLFSIEQSDQRHISLSNVTEILTYNRLRIMSRIRLDDIIEEVPNKTGWCGVVSCGMVVMVLCFVVLCCVVVWCSVCGVV